MVFFFYIFFLEAFWYDDEAQKNCWSLDSSENIMFPYFSFVQCSCFLMNTRCCFFIFTVNFGFGAALQNLSQNSLTNLQETILCTTKKQTFWIFSHELIEGCETGFDDTIISKGYFSGISTLLLVRIRAINLLLGNSIGYCSFATSHLYWGFMLWAPLYLAY